MVCILFSFYQDKDRRPNYLTGQRSRTEHTPVPSPPGCDKLDENFENGYREKDRLAANCVGLQGMKLIRAVSWEAVAKR
ncbi:MAG TPA: hypothetical protein VN426_08385 [Syntrophomonadaceae bacterium]|nr:hypothetical protein [Syntrophomonadaceae bacterium]